MNLSMKTHRYIGNKPIGKKKKVSVLIKNNWQLYIMILPLVIYFLIFEYLPMYGVQIAFRDYQISKGVMGSEWVGLKHFKNFFDAYYFKRLLSNTVILNVYALLWGFPAPIILAILLNRVRNERTKRFVQTCIYVPHFISTVVLAGMLYIFLAPTSGVFNVARNAIGLETVDFMSKASAFRTIFIASGIWKNAGYSSILYIANLSSVDTSLYEAADMDGANIWHKIWYIDIPTIIPTVLITLTLEMGSMFSSSTEKTLVLQTSGNISKSDIIGTYVYNMGLGNGQFSYTSAIGLFINIINFIMIITFNKISKKIGSSGLF